MRRWSEADDATLRRMAAAGATGSETARALGCTRDAAHGRARRLGIAFPRTDRKRAEASLRMKALCASPLFKAKLARANCKLTEKQRAEIRRRVLAGEKQSALAAEFSVSDSLVSRIKTRAEQEIFS